MRTYIVAEAGVNHNGKLELARQLIDAAAEAGADAVKFQSFRTRDLVSRSAPKAEYQLKRTDPRESQAEMLRKFELSDEDHIALVRHAESRRIAFMSTPFDAASLELLTSRLGLRVIKVASGEITNAPLLLAIARSATKVILSTGMSTLAEIEAALSVLAFGFMQGNNVTPGRAAFEHAYSSPSARVLLRERVVLLHCTSEYPAPIEEVNLRVMKTMADAFGLPVGYSDHTQGIHVSLAAVALGAEVLEKHITLDRSQAGPDHRSSLEPDEFRKLVGCIRDVETALGSSVKAPTTSEWKTRVAARRSIVAAARIRTGEQFSHENVTCKRPGGGLTPFAYWDVIGRTAQRDYMPDDMLEG